MGWTSYALKRLLVSVGILIGVSIIVFLIVRLIPGDPAKVMLGSRASPEAIEALRQRLGLNLPIWEQYLVWISDVVQGQWGESITSGQKVNSLVAERYPRSLELAVVSMIVAVLIAFPLGSLGALNRNSRIDYVSIFFSQVGVSVPSFWLGILLILFFARYLNILPPSGYVPPSEGIINNLSHIVLPSFSLGIINAAVITRYLRSEMLGELSQDYVRTAKAFGHPNRRIIQKYVSKNAMIPTITTIGIQFGYLMGGVVIIEQVFAYPGMGRLILNGLLKRNYPVVQVSLLVFAATFIAVNLVVDLLYGWLDPKIRY